MTIKEKIYNYLYSSKYINLIHPQIAKVTNDLAKLMESEVIAEGRVVFCGDGIGYMIGQSVLPSFGMSFNISEKLDECINHGDKVQIRLIEVEE